MARGLERKPDIPGSQFGNLPGIRVGTRWADRKSMSADHIHPPLVAGIYGRKADGARSVVLAGEFDDEDNGDTFTYIGSGGREPGIRFGPQTLNQTFDNNLNQALRISACRQKPVRVIRGPGLKSRYTPYAGFRYDGLYTVHNPRTEVAANGLLVCKFDFQRMPGQPPLREFEGPPENKDDMVIRRTMHKADRMKREKNPASSLYTGPVTAKWEGQGTAPSANAVASSSKAGPSTSRAGANGQASHRARSQSVDSVRSRSETPITISNTTDEWGEINLKELGLDDDDDEDEEEEDDQEDLFASIDKVVEEFRPMQGKLQELSRRGEDKSLKKARRTLLLEIGNYIRKVLQRKRQSSNFDYAWWHHELWAYVSTFLPTEKTMEPRQLRGIYDKYKEQARTHRRSTH